VRHSSSRPDAKARAVAEATTSDPSAPRLLCISQSYAPATKPTAIRASELLRRLSSRWDITVVTESERPATGEQAAGTGRSVNVNVVRSRRPRRLLALLRRLRLAKLIELAVWPDESIFWVLPAILAGRRIIKATRPSAIVVFMMPYSSGLVGVALSRIARIPLVLNLDDSPTCSDMHPFFPTRFHYRLALALEDRYARWADAIVYVSQANLEAVRSRQPEPARERFHLVRYGADSPNPPRETAGDLHFEIAYVGAMSGWWTLLEHAASPGPLRRLHAAWSRLGRYELAVLDQRTSSPLVIGQAILAAIAEHPDWAGRIWLTIQGNPYPESLVARALESAGIEGVVRVHGPVAHAQVATVIAGADLLFLTLPARLDGSRGGRISAKTYEYLATDRPILAAVPRGENWDYLNGKPGTWLLEPRDAAGMKDVIVELAAGKFAGRPRTFDRARLLDELSYDTRAAEFATVLDTAVERRSRGERPTRPR
jgi:glycosyl transferase family 4